jgi:NAD(P)-dependent dehydrogenase (short-subunit alcohol dehydrogenase family)
MSAATSGVHDSPERRRHCDELCFAVARRLGGQHRCIDGAGADAVDADAAGPVLERGHPREGDDRGLRRGIGRVPGKAHVPRKRGGVDDRCAHERIDVLVNNAGVFVEGLIDDMSDDDIRATFDVNTLGVAHGLRRATPHMGPGASATLSRAAPTASPSVTSARRAVAPMSAATARASSRSTRITVAPAATKRRAVARPMPEAPPVTTATRSRSENIVITSTSSRALRPARCSCHPRRRSARRRR